MLPDLFERPLLPGLSVSPPIVSAGEEQSLIENVDAAPLKPFRFQGWTGKRLTASYGWRYDFDGGRFAPTEPIPRWLRPLRARAAAFAALEPEALAHVLLIRYDPGAGIGWHRDRPVFDRVIGVSLGVEAVMRFRKRREDGFDRVSLPLAPRTAYSLSGEARQLWEHSIARIDAPRWSITFRTLRS